MNLINEIARRNRTPSPRRGVKYAAALGDRLGMAGGEVQTTDPRRMSATFVISTEAKDRVGDVMISRGCRLDNYRNNPVVLWDHNEEYSKSLPPIAMAECDGQLAVHVDSDHVISTAYFHGKTQLSTEIFGLVNAGAVRGASIGFLPIRGQKNADGHTFHEWELTEWSVTPLPMNAETLRLSLDRGLVKTKSLIAALEPHAAKGRGKSWSHGVDLPKGKKAMADMSEDEKKKAEEEEAKKKAAAESDDSDDREEGEQTGDEPPVDKSATEEPEDHSQKPGARSQAELIQAFDLISERLTDLMASNDHPELVEQWQGVLERIQADGAAMKALLEKCYPGADAASMTGQQVDPAEDDGMTAKAMKATVKEAADHLKALSTDGAVPLTLKAGCKLHAKALADLIAGVEPKKPEAKKVNIDEPTEHQRVAREVRRLAKRLQAV